MTLDVTAWEAKIAAVRCYETQFDRTRMNELVMALDFKSRQAAAGKSFEY